MTADYCTACPDCPDFYEEGTYAAMLTAADQHNRQRHATVTKQQTLFETEDTNG
jgi:hypothetical protein